MSRNYLSPRNTIWNAK